MQKSNLIKLILVLIFVSTSSMAAPFGEKEDVEYAGKLWAALIDAGLAGPGAVMSTPYTGQHPHGAVLDTIDSIVSVDKGFLQGEDTGAVIIKRNYGGLNVSKTAVANEPNKYLKAITVMFKRAGYDPDNKDWFWVKYKPNGEIFSNPKKMKLAGRVAKGMPRGCIACHKSAPGGNYVFNSDRIK